MVNLQASPKVSSVELSIVVPLFNEQESVVLLASEFQKAAKNLPKTTELILVNDGSNDQTSSVIAKVDWPWPVRVIELSRNFGHQAALLAGMEASFGQKVLTMDGDLQHPVSLIPQLLSLSKDYDIVLTQRVDGEHRLSLQKALTAKVFYLLVNLLSETPVPMNSSDFRLLNRSALNHVLAMPEHRKFLRGMVNWIGFRSVIVPFQVGNRVAGESKYSMAKMVQLAFHGVTSFSVLPLYFSGIFSALLFVGALVYALYVLYVRFVSQAVVSGWASVLLVLLVLGGFVSLFLGLIGFYLAAIFEEVKQRPAYIIRTTRQL